MTSVSLAIAGTKLRIAGPPRFCRRLRSLAHDLVTVENAPLGFVVRHVSPWRRGLVLTDRCGFVLGEATATEQMISMVASHLSALTPSRPDTVRLRVRALIASAGATLCVYPHMFAPTINESVLRNQGAEQLDRLAVDVDVANGSLVPSDPAWRGSTPKEHVPRGHCSALELEDTVPVRAVVVTPSPRSLAELATVLARQALTGTRQEVLDAAVHIASNGPALLNEVVGAGT